MHDDDAQLTPEPEESESYWAEADWERFMLENEKLMDRYEEVRKQNPDRAWDDPLDLYYKVHYDLDLGKDPQPQPSKPPQDATAGEVAEATDEPDEPETPVEEGELDDFRNVPAYQLAYAFALGIMEHLKQFNDEKPGQNPLRDELARHALRIAADIAGGHGLGYEEDTLCGNIVKNRWAFSHAQEARRLLQLLIERDGPEPRLQALVTKIGPIITALEARIVELRSKVWWDNAR